MTNRSLWGRALVGLVLCCLAVSLAIRAQQVHAKGWEWRLWPSAAPPKISYHQRDYTRSTLSRWRLDPTSLPRGETPGGGTIYAPSGDRLPLVVAVDTGDRIVEYSLIGGP